MLSPSSPGSRRALARWALLALAAAGLATLVSLDQAGSLARSQDAALSHMTDATHTRTPNLLAGEKSPYLLQHAYNPVRWYPWGEAAFAKARAENKPLFLSIGYSTCHWCHVMERESFENDSVAALLNEYFVPVKVDREERPDVDRIYMHAMQAMGMGGGWPLNVFLTPDLEPFFGGTYFPPDSMMGRPGMLQILPRVHEAWLEQSDALRTTGRQVLGALAGLQSAEPGAADRERCFDSAYAWFARTDDPVHGGFGNAPKFPSVANLNYLLRYWARDPATRGAALAMVTRQLDAMQAGGIHDHLGGGFHRYATDREWNIPHFEKMLYDQAQLATVYLDAFQATGNPRYAATARDVFEYVARDLTAPGGAFDSAEDADSEGEEGRFYVWTPAQLEAVVGPAGAALVAQRYGVTPGGNFEHGATVLHEAAPLEQVAAAHHLVPTEAARRIDAARATLLAFRARRPRPHRDDKVIAAWNGLMIAAFARGARVLGDPQLEAQGRRAAEFVWAHLWDADHRTLARRWRGGEAAAAGQLDDYACLAHGCLELYAANHDPVWLERAVTLTEAQVERFCDEAQGGFFESPAGDASIRLRMKDGFDGAELAGNSIAAANLVRLAVLLDRADWRAKANRTFDYFARRLADGAAAMPQMLVAFDLARATPRHIVIAGTASAPDTRVLIEGFERRARPADILLVVDDGEGRRRLAALAPWLGELRRVDGRATAYLCVNYACRLPVTDPAEFAAELDARQPAQHPQ